MQSPPCQRRGHQRQQLVSRVRPPRRIPEVEVMVNEFTQAHALGEGGRKEQPSIVDQAVVVEGDLDASRSLHGSIRWVLLVSGWFSVSKTIIPEAGSTFLSLHHDATLIFSVDWGLDQVPDHRKSQGRRHPVGSVLSLAVCAMLCGARSLYAIAQWGRDQGVTTGQLLGFSRGQTPCVATFHRLFKDLDVAAFEAVLREWLINSGVELGEVLSLDGKTLRGIHGEEIPGVHLVSAYAVRCGAVLAQAATPRKGRELEAAKEVLGLVPLQGRVVVADALLTQREVCQQIVAGGGDYLLPVKGNQPALYQDLVEAFFPQWKLRWATVQGCPRGKRRNGGSEGRP